MPIGLTLKAALTVAAFFAAIFMGAFIAALANSIIGLQIFHNNPPTWALLLPLVAAIWSKPQPWPTTVFRCAVIALVSLIFILMAWPAFKITGSPGIGALFPAAGGLIAALGSLFWVVGWRWPSSKLPPI